MGVLRLPSSGYVASPWKNGLGATEEICLLPKAATRDAFDLRVSRAVIGEACPFSSFPNVERTITLIAGDGLDLRFENSIVKLEPWRPYTFDSSLTPVGVPKGAAVRVLNVMAAKGVWRLTQAGIVTVATKLPDEPDSLTVVFALHGDVNVADSSGEIVLGSGDTAIVDGSACIVATDPAAALAVSLAPASSRK